MRTAPFSMYGMAAPFNEKCVRLRTLACFVFQARLFVAQQRGRFSLSLAGEGRKDAEPPGELLRADQRKPLVLSQRRDSVLLGLGELGAGARAGDEVVG